MPPPIGISAGRSWTEFNWALDYFDDYAEGNQRLALWLVDEDGSEQRFTYAQMSARSNQVANFLRGQGVKRGDTLLLMLDNVAGAVGDHAGGDQAGRGDDTGDHAAVRRICRIAWSGAVPPIWWWVRPIPTSLTRLGAELGRIVVGGWRRAGTPSMRPTEERRPSGRTVRPAPTTRCCCISPPAPPPSPSWCMHTHQSYPVGSLSTLYWIGLQPDDIHFNISSPGWAKHAWSNFFTPFDAGCTVFVYRAPRFSAPDVLHVIRDKGVTSLCAPPTVWRAFIQEDLAACKTELRSLVGAGEPLNPEVIARVEQAWGLTIRDGYGQTETTAQVGNPPGPAAAAGLHGAADAGLLGWRCWIRMATRADEGEIALALDPRPLGLMAGYRGDDRAHRDVPCVAAITAPVTWPAGTTTVTSGTWAAPTMCSRVRTTGSARSSWSPC